MYFKSVDKKERPPSWVSAPLYPLLPGSHVESLSKWSFQLPIGIRVSAISNKPWLSRTASSYASNCMSSAKIKIERGWGCLAAKKMEVPVYYDQDGAFLGSQHTSLFISLSLRTSLIGKITAHLIWMSPRSWLISFNLLFKLTDNLVRCKNSLYWLLLDREREKGSDTGCTTVARAQYLGWESQPWPGSVPLSWSSLQPHWWGKLPETWALSRGSDSWPFKKGARGPCVGPKKKKLAFYTF